MSDPIFVDTPKGDQLVILARADYDSMLDRLSEAEEDAADVAEGERGLAEWEAQGRQAFPLDDVKRVWPRTRVAARPDARPPRHLDWVPGHPGALLREIVIPATGLNETEIAHALGVSRQVLLDVLAEQAPMTADLAVRLGKMFGDGPETWLRMQVTRDVWTVSRALAGELEAIPSLAVRGVPGSIPNPS